MVLDNNEPLYLVLNGIPTDKGRSLMVDHPDLLGRELMVIAETKTPDAIVGTYALVGTVPQCSFRSRPRRTRPHRPRRAARCHTVLQTVAGVSGVGHGIIGQGGRLLWS